jgi:hypothetical protein
MPFPSSITTIWRRVSERVVIDIDPAKRTHAFDVIDSHEASLAAGIIVNDNAGYRQLLNVGGAGRIVNGRSRAPAAWAGSWSRGSSRSPHSRHFGAVTHRARRRAYASSPAAS